MLRDTARHFGWRPDLPDHRDYSLTHPSVEQLLKHLKVGKPKSRNPRSIDLREFCGPIQDQEDFNTSAAHACVSLIQQFERQSSGQLLQLSRLFLNNVAHRMDNSSISLRTALKAAVRCGIPPEKYLPYDGTHLNCEPDAFLYSFKAEFRGIRYVRVDGGSETDPPLLDRIKAFLAAGFPLAFGFSVCSSVGNDPEIPFPTKADTIVGGHAVTAVGYDDQIRIRSDRGALLVCNSWGESWGDRGFGWLPYAYVREQLATDFWTLLKSSWLKSGEFTLPQWSDE